MSAIYWLRRDVRLHDNPALCEAIKNGATTALFITTPKQWLQHDVAPIKADLFRRHLNQFATELQQLGMQLVYLHSDDYTEQAKLLVDYCRQNHIDKVIANSEPELDEMHRDKTVAESISLTLFQCDTILPPGSVLSQQGSMFKVFTPFKNAWLKRLREVGVECVATPRVAEHQQADNRIQLNSLLSELLHNSQTFSNQNSNESIEQKSDSSAWPLSSQVMSQVIPSFWHHKLLDYKDKRDIPSIKGTSGLSPYLAIGAISSRWLALQLIQTHPEVIYDTQHAAFAWLNELIWRDFYKHLLFHYPNLIKGECFQPRYQQIKWQNSTDDFNAWCQGRTGYPIVDAAMKQLLQTGWMHNRLRMIVASFLTKDLLIDWRWGERFFMQHLIDGDFSANNGGWQWAASTGCDAQPYFRIFNPITQSQKFDPNGNFIRKYLPELTEVPDKHIHFPHEYLTKNGMDNRYCPPIVDHKQARLAALALYQAY
ncbi:deoxyribodipyrimidine photo-lyase [Shewanella sp. Isolate11]|uniref:deoxyribodipyrimidine photo-lyase n=1 Tax=Shewanella sp. Isolate11 TaxID=2908530 RepID=UPI001EFE5138|nr:deoxyribodipyrimidine photo-lyase [Shewanella sp. Isolate11]MCG9697084.1 deoxyribodipyrimidine photo-lyase [Shewanella sp. Isolate11]